MHLILVEDNKADAFYLSELLEENFSSVFLKKVIDNGIEAIKYFSKFDFTSNKPIILLDINLPGNNGFEILEFLRLKYSKDELKVVILSTSKSETDKKLAFKLGANEYISKPINLDKIKKIQVLN